MANYYSDDRSTQILLALLKANGISKVVASPGTTNVALVGSMQYDSFFEIYSSVDERSAAYMACGIAYETGQPVVITCTEATASRDYLPGLTEAYYRKLPVLAITGNHGIHHVGHLRPQVIDRSIIPADTVRISVNIGKCKDKEDEWENIVNINKAILSLTHNGGGPAHINLRFSCNTYNTKELPPVRVIKRYYYHSELPQLLGDKIAVFIGSHKIFTEEELSVFDSFCDSHNVAVFCDKTSSYNGKYRVDYTLVAGQMEHESEVTNPDLLIHIGEVSGDTYTQGKLKPKNVWRVSEDGEIRDTFRVLSSVFQMREIDFFRKYVTNEECQHEYYKTCINECGAIAKKLPEIGLSNIWVARELSKVIPTDTFLHLGIYNSLRSWNFFPIDASIKSICNVGGFGIDGPVSTLVGASLSNPNILHFGVVGDLAFFYDINSLGNRFIKNNVRLLVINNGMGVEFRKKDHACNVFGDDAGSFMAAAGHFGNKSKTLVKDYAENLGYKYLSASSKDEFYINVKDFIGKEISQSIIFEVFTDLHDERNSVDLYRHIFTDAKVVMKDFLRSIVGNLKR